MNRCRTCGDWQRLNDDHETTGLCHCPVIGATAGDAINGLTVHCEGEFEIRTGGDFGCPQWRATGSSGTDLPARPA